MHARQSKQISPMVVLVLVAGLLVTLGYGVSPVRAGDEVEGVQPVATRVVLPPDTIRDEVFAAPPTAAPGVAADVESQATYHFEPWFSYHNNTGETIERLDLYVAIPPDRANQTLTHFSFSDPYELLADRYGQQVAHFRWTDIAPDAVVAVTWEWDAQVSSLDHNVDPGQVGDLDDIPADIRALYTEPGSMYRLDSAIVQAAAQDAIVGAGTLYEQAHAIYSFVDDRLSYIQDGRWDDAETVYLQRHGSCTEHAWLYIALCRANGIPARYVGGMMSMSDNHRWAEVYLPPYGWVPVDPTWHTFGVTPESVLVTTIGGGGSAYLDWTYNWLYWINRSEVLLSPPAQTNSGSPATWVRSTVEVRNQTGSSDSFDLSFSDNTWSTGLSDRSTGELANGEAFEVTVRMRVPATAVDGDQDTVTLHAVSSAHPERYSGSAAVTTVAHVSAQIDVSPAELVQIQAPGQITVSALTIGSSAGAPLSYHVVDPIYLDAALWLPLDEPAGATTFLDVSGNGNHGTCAGVSCPTAGAVGGIGNALEFDGIDARVPTALSIDQSSGTTGVTMAAWVYPTSDSAGRHHVISTDDGGFDWSIVRDGGTWYVFDGETSRSTNRPVDLDRWQLLVAVFRPGEGVHFFKNGMRTILPGLDYDDSSNNLTLGDNAGPWDAYFEGRIDDVVVWNRVLSYREVRALDQGGPLASWLSAAPLYGWVPAEDEAAIQVTFDSAGLGEGDYVTDLIVQSNDPTTPLTTVPVTLTVIDTWPQIAVEPAALDETLVEGETRASTLTISNLGTADLEVELSTAGGPLPWLSADPVSATIPAGSALAIEVTLDATALEPGAYSAQIEIASNDPLTPTLDVPVSLTVIAVGTAGTVQGTVTDADTGAPLAATVSVLGQPDSTGTDAGGAYGLTLSAGMYTLQVTAAGYVTETEAVTVSAQQTTTQDFALTAIAPGTSYLYLPIVIR